MATTDTLVGKAGLGEGHFFCVIGQFPGRCAHPSQTSTITTVHTDQQGAGNTAHHLCPWHQFLLVSPRQGAAKSVFANRSHLENPVLRKHLVCALLLLGQNNITSSI